ncbi:hypothetical protein GCK72_011497 [Caenorhabditis remanei]|uniref:Uncharacterized protein n=1 Tax=Caenorhabditis remanei TaxID=31234 RepID=A0A6A5H8S1_CAERE|nr:hypothetical protein GCK72_011497 [Caenorhabditis remanei]KAF1763231.1 hypothetical protein GCK72_011497 [Caenorhabditis remanei]
MCVPPVSPVSKVFSNQHLLENILSYLSNDFMQNLDVRLVNKSINNTFLRLIRQNHRRMKIEYICEQKKIEEVPKDYIYINYRKINNQNVQGYFIFLSTAVGVKVEKIITKRLWMLEKKFMQRLHNFIHSQLIGTNGQHIQSVIGLEEICDGCLQCSKIAKKGRDYGPVRFDTLKTMDYSKNYEKLHVSDKYLPNGTANLKFDHRHMPREVIDTILRKWSVKSIQLNMIYFTSEGLCSVDWLQYDYFTRVRLNDSYSGTEKSSDLKFTRVNVRMSDSIYCVKELGNRQTELQEPKGYDNFIPNIRRLFPTDNISIDLSHWYCIARNDIEKRISTILEVVTMEKEQKLSLNIKFFVELPKMEEKRKEEMLKIASQYIPREITLHCFKKSLELNEKKGFNEEKWIGKRFQVEDFNLDVYVKENELEEDKNLLHEYPNSFVNHFFSYEKRN